jgi:hypothetical protein
VEGWRPSDQKGFIDYYNARTNEQVRALVRLSKGWSDYQGTKGGQKMPSGFHFTVSVLECLKQATDSHDVAFVHTAEAVRERLVAYRNRTGAPIRRPVTPKENIFQSYDSLRLGNLIGKLQEVSVLGRKALNEADPEAAQRIWRELFGDRFKAPDPGGVTEGQKIWSAPAIIGKSDKAA